MNSVLLLALAGCPKYDPGLIPVEEQAKPVDTITQFDTASPNVYFQAVVRAGSAYDPPGKEGLAALTLASMVEAGAGDRTGPELRDALFVTGNSFEMVVDREYASLRLACHRDHADLCAELFADVLAAPTFRAIDVTRLGEQASYAVGPGLQADEEALGEAIFHATLYEAHPYSHPVRGRTGSIPLLTDSDVRAFHASHYVKRAVTVGLAGDAEPVHESLLSQLDALPSGPVPDLLLPVPNTPKGRGIVAVDTETEVTGVHLGHPLEVDRNHDDWAALTVGLTAFGAHRQSFGRLFRTLRGDRGLNYGDYAYAEPFVQRGWSSLPEQGTRRRQNHFSIWIRPTSVENGPFATKLAIDELERLVADGLSEQEFEDTVAYLERHTALEATTPGRRLAYALDAKVSGTPNVLEFVPQVLPSLTNDAVTSALQRHLHPDDLWIVAVSGQARAFADALIEENPTPIVYADMTPTDDVAKRDAGIADLTLDIHPDQVFIQPSNGVFR